MTPNHNQRIKGHIAFIHSVAHLAGELVRSLRAQGNDITDKDELCVQIAGLCHDLGELFTVH